MKSVGLWGASMEMRNSIEAVYKEHSRKAYATLVRLLDDFDRAEDALMEAFKVALLQWPESGIPSNPVGWLVSTGRFKAIDNLRRRSRFETPFEHLEELPQDGGSQPLWEEPEAVEDERLRLIFTCCHPAISPDAQVALTLREVCGLTTEEIASAFLIPAPTLAQRIVRAKSKIRDARIPFEAPEEGELQIRLQSVLRVVYLIFNEGYFASSGENVLRRDLVSEAIRLNSLIADLLPDPEVFGLMALMLLHESRRKARANSEGDLISLEEQDRSLWDQNLISRGAELTEKALRLGRFGEYTLQAAISAVHSQARSYAETDWAQIVGLYDALMRRASSPIVELNRAVAIAMSDSPETGITLIDSLFTRGELRDYHLAHAAKAELCRRKGDLEQARISYAVAIEMAQQEPERRFLSRRLSEIRA